MVPEAEEFVRSQISTHVILLFALRLSIPEVLADLRSSIPEVLADLIAVNERNRDVFDKTAKEVLLARRDLYECHIKSLTGLHQLPGNIGCSGADSAKQVVALSKKAADSVSDTSKVALSVVADINHSGSDGILQTHQRTLNSFGLCLDTNLTRPKNARSEHSDNALDHNAQPGPEKLAKFLYGDVFPVEPTCPNKQVDLVEGDAVEAKKPDVLEGVTPEDVAKKLEEVQPMKPPKPHVAVPMPANTEFNVNEFTGHVTDYAKTTIDRVKEHNGDMAARNKDIAGDLAARNTEIATQNAKIATQNAGVAGGVAARNAEMAKIFDTVTARNAELFEKILNQATSSSSSSSR